jgi:hypothetical protein
MSGPLPLAAASDRIRGKPGRPPVNDETKAKRAKTRLENQAAQLAAVTPRLLDLDGAAKYLSLTTWTLRDLIDNGTLQRVIIPAGPGRDVRRVLFDRAQLDELVLRWREAPR